MTKRKSIPAKRRSRRGFTIVELIVAIMILSIGVLGLASTAAVVAGMMGGGAMRTMAANVAQSRFEALRSVSCGLITAGSATTRGVTERWVATPIGVRHFDVTDSVSFYTKRGLSTQVYRSYVTC
ncbi:MAG: prepilin-type N-terminal cleavage/methylation domain-containing protein [Gemmatimonadaceae bacterium]